MTITSITFGSINGDNQALWVGGGISEILTPTGSNQATTNASAEPNRRVIRIATDVALYISLGAAPNATSDAIRFYLPAGAVEYYPVAPGIKAAIVLA